MAEPTRPSRARARITTLAVLISLALTAVAGSCGLKPEEKPPSVQDYLAKSHVYGLKKIRIGVQIDQPLMSLRDESGAYTGFDIEIARIIAAGLGFTHPEEIDFVAVSVEDRELELQRGGMDLVVASFSITDERRERVRFAGPYYVTTQEALVRTAERADVSTIEKLKLKRVCATGGSTSIENLRKLGFDPLQVLTDKECVDGILAGTYDALSTDNTILAGFQLQHADKLSIINLPFGGTEQLGIGVPVEDQWLEGLVGHILLKNYQKGENSDWQAAYNRTLGRALGRATQPPPLNVPVLADHDDRTGQSPGASHQAKREAPWAYRRRSGVNGRR